MKRRKISVVVTALTLAFVMALSPTLVFAQEYYGSDYVSIDAYELNFDADYSSIRLGADDDIPVLNLYGDYGNARRRVDSSVPFSQVEGEYTTGFAPASIASLPLITGRRTGTISQGQEVIYRMPRILSNEVLVNRAYSFVLQMPANADFDLFFISLSTGQTLAHNVSFQPGVTEYFTRIMPQAILEHEIGIVIYAHSGSGTYTVYAGPRWIGKRVDGSVPLPGGGMGAMLNVNWSSPGTWTIDLSNHPSIPQLSYMSSITLLGTAGGGNIDRTMTMLDQGGTIRGMFPALPIPFPRFNNGNAWNSHPVAGIWADQRLRFTLSGSGWTATQISMGLIFPVNPANLRFV